MIKRGSRRKTLLTALGGAMMLSLGACGVPQTQDTVNIYGKNTDEATQARVDRLVSYCQKLSDAGNFYLSEGMCNRAHDLDPTNPLPLLVMAENYKRYDRQGDAMNAYSVALNSHPESIEAAYELSKLQIAGGYENEALHTLQQALVHNPNEPKLLNIVGVVKDQQGDHDMAQFYYREALAQDPDNLSVSNNLGLSLALSGKGEEAVNILNDVASDPDAPATSQGNLALAYATAEANAAEKETAEKAQATEASDSQELYNEGVETQSLQSSDNRSFNDPLAQSFQGTAVKSDATVATDAPLTLMTSSFAAQSAPVDYWTAEFEKPQAAAETTEGFGASLRIEGHQIR